MPSTDAATAETTSISASESAAKPRSKCHCRPSLSRAAVERRLNLALTYYAYLRPHQSLDNATPAERFFGIMPPAPATSPPRGRPGDVTEPPPFDIVHLDDERRLPVLVPRAA
jgi:hypothetical protein